MPPTEPTGTPHQNAARPRWSEVLRALREARGVTLDGWGARIGVGRTTVQRWERGERAPDSGAEAALLTYCREVGLFRSYDHGPLAGVALTAELLQDLLAEARWGVSGRTADARSSSDRMAVMQTDVAPLGALGTAHSNLPAQLTSFIGREREIAAVRRVQAGTRLLTLTGAGGCGKTRLALTVAEELLPAYPDGVWFVDLAPLSDPALLSQEVASALTVRPTGPQPVTEVLLDALRARRLLLLLDNCEHLLPACAELVETLLRACPQVAVLATSRAPLGIAGEMIWRVPPMALLEGGDRGQVIGDSGEEPEQADAVRLFLARARLQRPELALTPSDLVAVAEICRRLDGMPLAIELAAARMNVLSAGQIAARLHDRFRLLTSGGRMTLPRHQTLHAAIDWSHELLTGPEQTLLHALSVFAAGFTLEAAEAVCGEPAMGSRQSAIGDESSLPPTAEVLDLLARLVDQSLVAVEQHGDVARYRMLETVREFAAEQLAAGDEARAVRDRHATWCAALAEASMPHRAGRGQEERLAQLSVEEDNIRAALGWCLTEQHAAAIGLQMATAMWWFWEVRGQLSEGRNWLDALLARAGDATPEVRARAMNHAGWLALRQADYDEAERLIEQSIALQRERGDDSGVAAALNSLGVVANALGDLARAQALYEEALSLQRKLGNRHAIASAANNLGIIARQQGAYAQAEALFEESMAMQRQLGDTRGVAGGLFNLGNVYRDQGALETAAARYRESLTLYRELHDRPSIARCLEGMAAVDAARSDARRAARLSGAAAALREATGVPPPPDGRAAIERTTTAARAALGEAAFAATWAAGASLSLEQAIVEALAEPASG